MFEKVTKVVDEFQDKVMDYKTQLMGWSIILIVLCHSSATGISFLSVFGAGMIGADIFILLSGYSLGFSIKKYPIIKFYQRRISRIYPMYLILALSECTLIHLLSSPLTISDFISTALFLPYYGLWGGILLIGILVLVSYFTCYIQFYLNFLLKFC